MGKPHRRFNKADEHGAKNRTLVHYAENAEAFASPTAGMNLFTTQKRFAALLPAGGRVLDLECGSGRAPRTFLGVGFDVTATDESPRLYAITKRTAGIPVRNELIPRP